MAVSSRTAVSTRVARVLLVGAATASLGLAAYILAATSDRVRAAPVVLVCIVIGALFLLAHRRTATDPVAARLYALSAACGLAGVGVLTGFGAGTLGFPAAGLGIAAAASLFASRDRRVFTVGVAAYLLVGVVVWFATRYPFSFFSPFVVLLWPLYVVIVPGAFVAIFAVIGAAGGLATLALARDRGAPLARLRARPLAVAAALAGGVIAVAIDVASAYLDESTSARFELVPIALAVVFLAGVGIGLAFAALRDAPALAALGVALSLTLGLFVIVSGPAVRCGPNGVSTGAGPWWLGPATGPLSSSGGSGSSTSGGITSGEIRRGDGIVVRYRCDGARASELVIER